MKLKPINEKLFQETKNQHTDLFLNLKPLLKEGFLIGHDHFEEIVTSEVLRKDFDSIANDLNIQQSFEDILVINQSKLPNMR